MLIGRRQRHNLDTAVAANHMPLLWLLRPSRLPLMRHWRAAELSGQQRPGCTHYHTPLKREFERQPAWKLPRLPRPQLVSEPHRPWSRTLASRTLGMNALPGLAAAGLLELAAAGLLGLAAADNRGAAAPAVAEGMLHMAGRTETVGAAVYCSAAE